MRGHPVASAAMLAVAVLLGASACGGEAEPQSEPTAEPPPGPVSEPPGEPPPPPPDDCPQTPVVLAANDLVIACAVTPSYWTVKNVSRTVLSLRADSLVTFTHVAGEPSPLPPSYDDVASAIVDIYRRPYDGTYFLQPGDTVGVTWPGDPSVITYTPDPGESAGRAVAVEILTRAAEQGLRQPPRQDALDCLWGVAEATEGWLGDSGDLQQSWNVAVEDAFTGIGCAGLVSQADQQGEQQAIAAVQDSTSPAARTATRYLDDVLRLVQLR